MKLSLLTCNQPESSECRAATSGFVPTRQNSALRHANGSRGVALVVTLLMLSIITFLSVAFLAMSNRNRKAGGVAANQTDSRLMAQTAEARAASALVARMMGSNSIYSFDLMATTNYLNPAGFNSINTTNWTNVNYETTSTGTRLSTDQHIQNVGNLFYDPRPPVYINTNTSRINKNVSNDFRFYLDLNRNGVYDANGYLPVLDDNGVQIVDSTTNGNIPRFDNFVGDPEWIGILEKPELPHSPTNRFIGRYAYVVLPVGKTLDLNYIHNQAKRRGDANDGFFRNQGFGSWEINYAAFLRDLNTNIWTVATYNTNFTKLPSNSSGDAYTDDAVGLLRHRYNNGTTRSYNNLATVEYSYGTNSAVFTNDLIDGYVNEPLMSASSLISDNDVVTDSWWGSRNPNRFYDMQELFGTNMNPPFVVRLKSASSPTNKSSYNRYTFYRMLQQMGTESAPELKGKINLNYINDPTQNYSATNWISWSTNGPLQFFTNVAQRLIETHLDKSNPNNWIFDGQFVGTNFALTNIQLFPTNYYTATTHRLLQVAANIYDAMNTNRSGTNFPSIFRPTFGRSTTGGIKVYISGYVEETNAAFLGAGPGYTNGWVDLGQLVVTNLVTDQLPVTNVYGQAIVIGVKKSNPDVPRNSKGFPNFNRVAMQSQVYAERKLEFRRPDASSEVNETNQMFILGITNVFGVEAWNSFTNGQYSTSQKWYPRPLVLRGDIQSEMVITNETGLVIWPANNLPFRTNFPFGKTFTTASPWTNDTYFVAMTNNVFLTNSIYTNGNPVFFRPLTSDPRFERSFPSRFPDMKLVLLITNRVRYFLMDGSNVVDFVNITNMTAQIDIITNLVGEANFLQQGPALSDGDFWRTNRPNNSTSINVPTFGVLNQIMVNTNGGYGVDALETAGFNNFLFGKDTNLVHQAPYSPKRQFRETKTWAANDPFVHYMLSDLVDPTMTNNITYDRTPLSLGTNDNMRYRPWGGRAADFSANDKSAGDINFKDAGIWNSDAWDFPTNKFPNIGWIGRIHRGTPWQTIYLKSSDIRKTNEWKAWAGSDNTHPTNDWRFADLFTVAPNDNAARGLLSVNQTNIAAWSAVLSGVLTLSNSANGVLNKFKTPQFSAVDIKPNSFQLKEIVNELNALRARKPNGQFRSIGDILEATNLTVNSRFLNTADAGQRKFGLTDAAYERIPQQVLSLLKLGEPRFVIYSFGQSLKPAENSIVLNPGIGKGYLFNLCTNYQVMGEVVTRTVLRVEGKPDRPRTVIESYNVVPGAGE